jgi:hypothetical protein
VISVREPTTYPRPPHVFGKEIGEMKTAEDVSIVETYRYTHDVIINGEIFAVAGDVWGRINKPIEGWIPIIHKGKTLPVLPFSLTIP